MIKSLLSISQAAVLCTALLGSAPVLPAPEAVVAIVNGEQISRDRLDTALEVRLRAEKSQRSDASNPERVKALQQAALEQVISLELFWQEAKARDFVIGDDRIEEVLKSRRAQFKDENEYLAELAKVGLTEESYRDSLRRSLSIRALADSETGKLSVSPEEVEAFYHEQIKQMRRPEQVRVRHILVGVPSGASEAVDAAARQKIETLLARAKAGEEFEQLAEQFSEGPSKAQGGDLGYVGRGQMVPPFEQAAFGLVTPGQLSDVVRTRFGYHIIRLEGRRGGDIASLEDASNQIHDYLLERKSAERFRELEQSLRTKAKIELFDLN